MGSIRSMTKFTTLEAAKWLGFWKVSAVNPEPNNTIFLLFLLTG